MSEIPDIKTDQPVWGSEPIYDAIVDELTAMHGLQEARVMAGRIIGDLRRLGREPIAGKSDAIMVDISRLVKAAKLTILIHELGDACAFSGWSFMNQQRQTLFGTQSLNCLNDLYALVDKYDV